MSAAKRRRQKLARAAYVHYYLSRRGIVICDADCPDCEES